MTLDISTQFKKLSTLYSQVVSFDKDKLYISDQDAKEALDRLVDIFKDTKAQEITKEINRCVILMLRPVIVKYVAIDDLNPFRIIIKTLVIRYVRDSIKRIESIFATLGAGVDLTQETVYVNLMALAKSNQLIIEQQIQEVDAAIDYVKK